MKDTVPGSFNAVSGKLNGHAIGQREMFAIVEDITKGRYTDSQLATFCSACRDTQMSYDEVGSLTKAMVETGERITWDNDIVVDKHCIGGVPGNRTTNIAIPIVASFGLCIPKLSSRAITAPAGTADTMEVFCTVALSVDKIRDVVARENGCIALGGAGNLCPSDSIIIDARKASGVNSDGLMVASVLSKKIAAGSTHALIVVPVGSGMKAENDDDFNRLKTSFETVGNTLGIKVLVAREDGKQPIGNGVGPVPEAIDILKVLKNESDAPQDLRNISIELAGQILEFSPKVKKGEGAKLAEQILTNGAAYNKFVSIARAQGNFSENFTPSSINIDILADKSGTISSISNNSISQLCRIIGTTQHKDTGVYLYKHLGDQVKQGEKLFTVYFPSQESIGIVKDLFPRIVGIK